MKKLKFGKLIESKRFVFFFSLFIAIIAWLIVFIQFDPTGDKTIRNVPVIINVENSSLIQDLNLEVINQKTKSIDVTVNGKLYKMGNLSPDDFEMTVSLSDVSKEGEYKLDITSVRLKDESQDYKVTDWFPRTVEAQFATVSSKTITLEADAPNISAKDGYTKKAAIADPVNLEVRGPNEDINQLDRIVLRTNQTRSVDATFQTEEGIELLFYNANGEQMKSDLFQYDKDTKFKITVPIYKQKTVPLTFKYRNAPASLDTSKLRYTMTANGQEVSEIKVIGPADAVDNLKEINLGYVSLYDLDVDKTFKFDIPMTSGFENADTFSQVTIDFSQNNLKSGLFTVREISLTNLPDGYDVQVDTTEIKNVKAVWSEELVSSPVVDSDLAAMVDFTNQTLKEGRLTVPVTIDVISKDGVWVVGHYECTVTATAKTG